MPNLSRLFIYTILSLAFCAAEGGWVRNQSLAATAKKYHCWKIDQQNMFFGDCTIYASPEAVKIVFKNGKWINLSKGPGWDLYVLNPQGKIYCVTKLDHWKANILQPSSLTDMKNYDLVRSKDEQTICGVKAVRVEYVPKPGQRKMSNGFTKQVYWIARDIKLPDPISHIMCSNSALPQLHAIPLRSDNGSEIKTTLNTTGISQVDMPVEFFDMPRDYKFTDKNFDVMDAGVGDIIKDMTGL